MQKWEYVAVNWEGSLDHPGRMKMWPSGVIDLKWLNERFGVKIGPQAKAYYNTMYIDIPDKLYEKAPDVSKAFLQYLGLNGWELVTVDSDDNMFFKRPLEP